MKVLVLTVSDRASRGVYDDRSGPAIESVFRETLPDTTISRSIVPDDEREIIAAFERNPDTDVIITTGGTGIGPRDVTPEATVKCCDRLIDGIADYLRRESCKQTVNAVLSRGTAGVRGKTIIINLPGSVKGATFCAELLMPVLPHALAMLKGEGH
jgi:molybdopterin adenylyltransferase